MPFSVGCLECIRLSDLFSAAIRKSGELRAKAKDVTVLKGGDRIAVQACEHELTVSTAEISSLRRQLLDHEATHRDNRRVPSDESQSSSA